MSDSGATVICILGMHRSGTSLVSRILNLLGVHLGPRQAISITGEDNPKGYWEHHPIALLNDEILARFGGAWDRPPKFPPGWQRDVELEALREKARRLVRDDFSSQPMWGWKDPRTCLTLPFWQELVHGLRYVICVRNPSAVIASLARRNAMAAESAERLWLSHVHSALTHTAGHARVFVGYEELLADWRPELARLAAFIGQPARATDPGVCSEVEQFLDAEMCHHRLSMEELAGDPAISFPTKAVYVAIRGLVSRVALAGVSAADGTERGSHNALDLLAGQALDVADLRPAAELERLARENERLAATAAAVAGQRDRLAAEAEARANEVIALTARLDDTVGRQEQALRLAHDLQADLRVIARDRDARARDGEAAQQALDEIRASVAWRFVVVSRRVAATLMPPGSRRRSLFDSVLHTIGRRLPPARRVRSIAED